MTALDRRRFLLGLPVLALGTRSYFDMGAAWKRHINFFPEVRGLPSDSHMIWIGEEHDVDAAANDLGINADDLRLIVQDYAIARRQIRALAVGPLA